MHLKRREKQMKGALVFLAVFAILLLATLAYSELPPGGQIYDAFNFPTTTYQVFDTIPVRTLANAVFNGVIFGIIAWLIYTIAERATNKKTTTASTSTATNVAATAKLVRTTS